MPFQMSSRNSVASKVGRKVRVAVGNSVVGRTSSDVDKGRRKVRVGKGGLERSSDVDGIEKNWSKEVRRRGNGNSDVSYVDGNENLGETRSRGKGDFKTKSRDEGFGKVGDGNSGQKRKRVYADSRVALDKMFDGNDRKSNFKSKNNMVRSYFDKDKAPRGKDRDFKDSSRNRLLTGNSKLKDRDFKDSSRNRLLTGNSKLKGSDSRDRNVRRGKMEGDDEYRHVRQNCLRNGESKASDKKKAPLATKTYLNKRISSVNSVEKPGKKNDLARKSSGTSSDSTEEPRMKTKRVIRIDRHDISNKRLDDDIANNGNSQAKIDSAENTAVEMSKNAQFRAIQPSSSILSFVEDNLLGRRREIEFRRAGYNIELPAPLDNIPSSTGPERERIEVPDFRNKLEFFAAAKVSSSFPPPDLSEIAFAGRSNVGKSSLLNALTRQWGVVRTSDKPGLTQTINFFKLGSKLCLVDLPGYGFAYAKEEVKEAWEELVKEYVSTRVGLKRVCLLVDTKWGLKPRDHELIDLMERSETKYQIVLTKTDSVFPIDVARRAMQIEENLRAKKSAVQPLMMVSSKTGAGIRSLRTVLANVAKLVRR